jgi:hypothetical protein
MTDQHLITPPPELVQQWLGTYFGTAVTGEVSEVELFLATQATRWGADQELEAILKLVGEPSFPEWDRCFDGFTVASIREERRPKPTTLKEQALTALHAVATGANDIREQHQDLDTIRKALEALPND